MVAAQPQTWQQVNQRDLISAITQVRSLLEYYGRSPADPASPANPPPQPRELTNAAADGSSPSALQQLCQVFGLSAFERNILLLCAGMEFVSQWGTLCASALGNSSWTYPTFGLAHLIFEQTNWQKLTPMAPLRRYRLIEVQGGTALMTSQLRLDERILHYLMGIDQADARLQALAEAIPTTPLTTLVPSHQAAARQIIQTWLQTSEQSPHLRRLPIAQLGGSDRDRDRQIAAAVCDHFSLNLYTLGAQSLPTDLNEVAALRTLCEREYRLERAIYLVELVDYGNANGAQKAAIAQFIETMDAPVLISSDDRYPQQQRSQIYLAVQAPTKVEQQKLWQSALADLDVDLNGHVAALTSHFNLNASVIDAACLHVKVQRDLNGVEANSASPDGAPDSDPDNPDSDNPDSDKAAFSHVKALWGYCRSQARPRLDELAQRIEAQSTWEHLVLPDKEQALLKEVAAHVRQRSRVYDTWGFGRQGTRGLGISALFAGASGTGKTLSAEVIANDLHLDLYRIDLSSIVSKYIGETEKNLRRVFDAAEGGGVILLFDEADALFGKRSEVKDSHDRYANMEVSYLLQRMESYQGLAILTTNLKRSMDQAFLRRLRFVVQFPFPDAAQRAEIWRRIFPVQMPRDELKYDKLAKLSIPGGNIRNIAINAAFIAADADEAVGMKHILQAAKGEYSKLERPLTDAEVKGWI
ncbi:MAG: ATP-binding protein [Cyanobacteria bacterium P01_A01_bin.123]